MISPAALPIDCCNVCGGRHASREPHSLGSLMYQANFKAEHGRKPTWSDAVAHCPSDVRESWKAELMRSRVWTEVDNPIVSLPSYGKL